MAFEKITNFYGFQVFRVLICNFVHFAMLPTYAILKVLTCINAYGF